VVNICTTTNNIRICCVLPTRCFAWISGQTDYSLYSVDWFL